MSCHVRSMINERELHHYGRFLLLLLLLSLSQGPANKLSDDIVSDEAQITRKSCSTEKKKKSRLRLSMVGQR